MVKMNWQHMVKTFSCIEFVAQSCLKPLSNEQKSHVQIMRFKCCLNMGFNLTKPKLSAEMFACVTWESVAALTDHFADAFVRGNDVRVYDIVAT